MNFGRAGLTATNAQRRDGARIVVFHEETTIEWHLRRRGLIDQHPSTGEVRVSLRHRRSRVEHGGDRNHGRAPAPVLHPHGSLDTALAFEFLRLKQVQML